MKKIIIYFEKFVILVLMALMAIVIAFSLYELAALIITEIFNPRDELTNSLFAERNILKVLSFIMLVVISLELFETMKFYLDRHIISADFIILVALTAVARKVIIMDYSLYEPLMVIGMGVIIIALSLGYYFIKKADFMLSNSKVEEKEK